VLGSAGQAVQCWAVLGERRGVLTKCCLRVGCAWPQHERPSLSFCCHPSPTGAERRRGTVSAAAIIGAAVIASAGLGAAVLGAVLGAAAVKSARNVNVNVDAVLRPGCPKKGIRWQVRSRCRGGRGEAPPVWYSMLPPVWYSMLAPTHTPPPSPLTCTCLSLLPTQLWGSRKQQGS